MYTIILKKNATISENNLKGLFMERTRRVIKPAMVHILKSMSEQ
jgi:hypothetical protein